MNDVAKYLDGLPKWSGSGTFSLEPIQALLKALGNPQEELAVIHVAGTNGKGSVAATIASILAQGGHRVGLYTSPHLQRVEERIVVDGLPVVPDQFATAALEVKSAAIKAQVTPSFFEVLTAMAFVLFRQLRVEFAVIEVGLGGRLDATNVVQRPLVSVITTIDFDHQHLLGDTLAAIAGEKAGIVKQGCPVVCGDLVSEAQQVVRSKASELSSPLFVIGRDFHCKWLSLGVLLYSDPQLELEIEPGLRGHHQGHNMALAIRAAQYAGASSEQIIKGCRNVRWPGRLESMQWEGREVLIDAGHNPAGIRSLAAYLKELGPRRWSCGFGAISTKNWREMIDILLPFVERWSLLRPEFHEAVPCAEIARYIEDKDRPAQVYDAAYPAFFEAESRSESPLLLTGSIYLIGALRGFLQPQDKPLWSTEVPPDHRLATQNLKV